jgi:phage protein D
MSMGAAEQASLLVPDCQVLCNGQALPLQLARRLVSALVDDEIDLPGMFELEFAGAEDLGSGGSGKDVQVWFDDPPFALGDEVELRLGYAELLDTAIVGEVVALEPHFSADRPPGLTVRGYDRRHRLTRGRKSRTFAKAADSAVAKQIADALSIPIDVEDSGPAPDYLLQHNQTDLEFLRERAQRIGYALTMQGKTLRFKPAAYAAAAAVQLEFDRHIIEFEPRLSAADQATALTLRGWDVRQKAPVDVDGDAGALPAMGGKDTGTDLAKRAFGTAPAQLSQVPVVDRDEGERLARAALVRRVLRTITGEARLWGRADIAAGSVVNISGVGQRFSGDYYVHAIAHRYEPHRSFHTTLQVMRTAI